MKKIWEYYFLFWECLFLIEFKSDGLRGFGFVLIVSVVENVMYFNELNSRGVLFFYEVVVKGDVEEVKLLFFYGVEVNR